MISKSLCNPLPLNLCTPGDGISQVPPLVLSSPLHIVWGTSLPRCQGCEVWVACVALRPSQEGGELLEVLRFWEVPFAFLWHPGLCLLEVSGVERDFLSSFAAMFSVPW